jgi:hypothetical protein
MLTRLVTRLTQVKAKLVEIAIGLVILVGLLWMFASFILDSVGQSPGKAAARQNVVAVADVGRPQDDVQAAAQLDQAVVSDHAANIPISNLEGPTAALATPTNISNSNAEVLTDVQAIIDALTHQVTDLQARMADRD